MGVVTEGFFSITTLALAPSLMLGFAAAAAALTADVSCFTTVVGIVALTTAEVLVIVLMVFSFKTFIKKDSSGSAASHRINFDLFVAAMGSTLECIKRNLYYLKLLKIFKVIHHVNHDHYSNFVLDEF
jgi:hypothetical protein